MPKKTVNNIGLWVGLVSTFVVTVLTPLSQLEFPEWWSSVETDKLVAHEVHQQMQAKYKEDSTAWIGELEHVTKLAGSALAKCRDLEMELDHIKKDSFSVARKHRQFNTDVNSIQSDLLTEEMELKIECDYEYYVTNNNDAWNIFGDMYHSRVPYSLDRKSGCRVYYTPLYGNKQSAK